MQKSLIVGATLDFWTDCLEGNENSKEECNRMRDLIRQCNNEIQFSNIQFKRMQRYVIIVVLSDFWCFSLSFCDSSKVKQ
jgi:hypothetical protein